jgi:deoxyhypusine monooxygenase
MAFEDVQIAKPTPETYQALDADLCNHSGKVPLHERFRALFTLKALADNESVDIVGRGKIKRIHSLAKYIQKACNKPKKKHADQEKPQ